MTGEIAGYVMEKLFDAGALDVFYTPIFMKKNRPAMKLTVLSSMELLEDIQKIILAETTSLGIRMYKTQRLCMERKVFHLHTPYGSVRIKEANFDGIKKYAPEYEDCRKVAEAHSIPIKEVYNLVLKMIED